jgi:MFS family permease
MGIGQLLFALAPSYPMALFARFLLGCGDALTYVSTLRYAATHFNPRRYPLIAAVTGTIGTAGNVVATLPLAMLLHSVGWAPVYPGASIFGGLTAVAAYRLIPDATVPPPRPRNLAAVRAGVDGVFARVRLSWALPGTRLGFWLHFSAPCVGYAFSMLWGDPYLIKAGGFSSSAAGSILMAGVIVAAAIGPVLGELIARHPHTRAPIALGFGAFMVLAWLGAFALGVHPPRWYIVALFVVMTIGGPISMFAFALARDYNHTRVLGTASGVVNVGGFVATTVIALGMGWVLDGLGGTTAPALRWAILVAVGVQLFGLAKLLRWYRRLRAHVLAEQEAGNAVPVPAVRRRWDLAPE